jgi:GntR family transcriptional regulator / MocR family aminotransferase
MTSPSHPVELLVALDRGQRVPLSDQLATQISSAIRRGSLKEGSNLPASRTLAAELGVSRGVVTAAYAHLVAQGYLLTQTRSVPRVAAVRPVPTSRPPGRTKVRVDFTMLSPDLSLLPRGAWKRALIDTVQTAPLSAFDYGDPRGERELRAALADFLGRTRGLIASHEQIIICQGTVQAMDVACQTLVEHGAGLLAIEEPCANEVRRCAGRAGLRVEGIEVDLDGLRTERLLSSDAEAALATPAHQFPTGSVMTKARRETLAAWLSSPGRFLIEDDYDAEFRYDAEPMAALQGAFPDRVLYLGSASKTFAPGLRLGWLVVPDVLIETASSMKWALDAGSPSLNQLAFARVVVSGAFERHLVKARSEYRRRRAALRAGLAGEIPHSSVEGASAGMHLVLRLPDDLDREALELAAELARMKLESVEGFLSDPPRSVRRLVLSYARLHPSRARTAAKALAAVVQAARYESAHLR